jgi:hypothetical protein
LEPLLGVAQHPVSAHHDRPFAAILKDGML